MPRRAGAVKSQAHQAAVSFWSANPSLLTLSPDKMTVDGITGCHMRISHNRGARRAPWPCNAVDRRSESS
jgi:hypothetical protein